MYKKDPKQILEGGRKNYWHERGIRPREGLEMLTAHSNTPPHPHHLGETTGLKTQRSRGRVSIPPGKRLEALCMQNNFNCIRILPFSVTSRSTLIMTGALRLPSN